MLEVLLGIGSFILCFLLFMVATMIIFVYGFYGILIIKYCVEECRTKKVAKKRAREIEDNFEKIYEETVGKKK